ncbi:hypothetical protein Cob_v008877 [Colletotrichum orbiculare MAFF 240422]|uniref:Uncharacterized protein n=1 Tax=Colletotrichum orbiculare (strain 104-T / ATCC 96160 / CBS 514.97 / LARS 414 / MAFF 240422) TaxID=1213857 RepID=N4UQX7_COLOR|nr:hypothetical protein Cob_v008877 [Colletotrichum orbiculare MAFF 240422]
MPALPPGSSSFVSTAANSTGLPSTSTPCYTVTVTNGTVTQVVTKSVLIPTVTASAETTTLYPPQTFNHTAYPPRPTCTSHWLNRTSLSTSVGYPKTWTSVKTNRTSSADLTTFLTSTASRSDFTDEGTSVVLRTVKDGLPAPTTTVSAVPLPSNRAYPWGGVGPLFRHHNMTDGGAVDRANAPHTQVRGAWWGRWEKHSDRLLSDKDEDDA